MPALAVVGLTSVATPAAAFTQSSFVSFTLEGCKNAGGIVLPDANGDFICADAAYTTGNLDKGWNELDLVPHRLTTSLGNQSGATTTYSVYIAADYQTSGKVGYDVISAPVVNDAKSDDSCSISAGAEQTAGTASVPFGGGTDVVRYRELTITQNKGTTCVFDYYQRLAVGAHLYPGSSLQSYMFEQDGLTGSKKTLSIPVKEIQPQSISKTMAATKNSNHIWTVSKSPTPASLYFGDTCSTATEGASLTVDVKVTWTKSAANPTGYTVTTTVRATNPAARVITTAVTDVIYSGTTALDTKVFDPVNVPANTANYLIGTHAQNFTIAQVPGDPNFNDVATATYTDLVTGVAVPGTATATASVADAAIGTGTTTNATATITDTESISGTGLTFSVATPSVGSFTNYTAGDKVTGPVNWSSGSVNASGSVTFAKTVYLDEPRIISSASLSDTATVTGADSGSSTASASVGITSTATVALTIDKTIPIVLSASDGSRTFTFPVSGPTSVSPDPTVSFATGHGGSLDTHSTSLTGLAPGSYTVNETTLPPYAAQTAKTATINLPSCTGSVSFENNFGAATARVLKTTVPSGSESGWTFTLTGPGLPVAGVTATTTGTGYVPFEYPAGSTFQLQEGSYLVTETGQTDWDNTAVSMQRGSDTAVDQTAAHQCTFTVDYDADADQVFSCTFANTQRGSITIVKDAVPDGAQDFAYTTSGTGLAGFSLDDDADATLPNSKTFSGLLPGGYSVTETAVANWDLTSLSCVKTRTAAPMSTFTYSGATANITLAAGDSVTCTYVNTQRAHVTVEKKQNGATPTVAYSFRLTGTGVDITKTTSAGQGSLDFGYLKPGAYTLCELSVPVGTHSTLQDPPYNGTFDPATGNVCVSFTLAAGDSMTFTVDNTYPLGNARTIGYWKNWNTCAKATWDKAAKTGNHLMDEFLPMQIAVGTYAYTVPSCVEGVSILSTSSAKYAEHALAAQLFAAELNVAAGAAHSNTTDTKIAEAEGLLGGINWMGSATTKIIGPNDPMRSAFLDLAAYLDGYNNNLYS